MISKKTKIVATLGPASSSVDVLREMLIAGLDVARINFSHGSHEIHAATIKNIRQVDEELGRHTAILADLQGPKLRIGEVENNAVLLEKDNEIIFTNKKVMGTAKRLYMTYQQFAQDVQVGETILLDDGKLSLRVKSTNQTDEVVATVVHGGILSSKKGVNLPNTKISLPCLTEKDLADLEMALSMNVDWIGLSFVRNARDIIELRHIIRKHKKHTRIIAKIEKPEAIADIDDIIQETDAIMVARGDLGVEVPLQNVPLIQKSLVKKCMRHAKPVIVATQMMESMIESITPTRAEVNDVANAVLDGADAVMLSAETSVGKHPVKVIETMASIVKEIETYPDIYYKAENTVIDAGERFVTDSICVNATHLTETVGARAIVTMTLSGYTAFKISSHRPNTNIFVFTSNKKILCQLNLLWGVRALYYDKLVSTDHTIADIRYILKKLKFVKAGDFVIHLASMPISEMGRTNMMKVGVV